MLGEAQRVHRIVERPHRLGGVRGRERGRDRARGAVEVVERRHRDAICLARREEAARKHVARLARAVGLRLPELAEDVVFRESLPRASGVLPLAADAIHERVGGRRLGKLHGIAAGDRRHGDRRVRPERGQALHARGGARRHERRGLRRERQRHHPRRAELRAVAHVAAVEHETVRIDVHHERAEVLLRLRRRRGAGREPAPRLETPHVHRRELALPDLALARERAVDVSGDRHHLRVLVQHAAAGVAAPLAAVERGAGGRQVVEHEHGLAGMRLARAAHGRLVVVPREKALHARRLREVEERHPLPLERVGVRVRRLQETVDVRERRRRVARHAPAAAGTVVAHVVEGVDEPLDRTRRGIGIDLVHGLAVAAVAVRVVAVGDVAAVHHHLNAFLLEQLQRGTHARATLHRRADVRIRDKPDPRHASARGHAQQRPCPRRRHPAQKRSPVHLHNSYSLMFHFFFRRPRLP